MTGPTGQILSGLGRLAAFWRAGQWQTTAALGLNPTQADILARIAVRPERGAELAAHLGVTPATLSDSVTALVAKGLAARHPDPDDGRAQRVAPTAEGATLAAALPAAPAALAAAVAALPEEDRSRLLVTLLRIIRALQLARAIPVQRMCVTCRHFRPHAHDDAAAPHHCAFVDAAFGEAALRLDCGDHAEAAEEERARNWARFDAAA
jgi:DNA-binding MarR family transcriptional regulator